MKIVYDEEKEIANLEKHGISFDEADMFDWEDCATVEDTRYHYGERRFISYGYIFDRLHVLVWTPRVDALRVISLRKANKKEEKRYG